MNVLLTMAGWQTSRPARYWAPRSRGQAPMQALVVEDSVVHRKLISDQLQSWGLASLLRRVDPGRGELWGKQEGRNRAEHVEFVTGKQRVESISRR